MQHRKIDEIPDGKGGAAIAVRVVTGADRVEIVGFQDDGMLKIRVVAGDNESANKELIGALASHLSVDTSRISVVAGENKNKKMVTIEGVSTDQVRAVLSAIGS